MRLNAFLAKAGVASRRAADDFIKAGRVSVNGEAGKLNHIVSEDDTVEVDGKQVILRNSRYILLYKPPGYVTTSKDTHGRPIVNDLIKIQERVVPVGRLDRDTTGALLMTNDGQLAHRLMHPSFNIDKVYEAEVRGAVTPEKLKQLASGIEMEEGKTAPAKAKMINSRMVELTIHEGKKHQVKRMLAAVDLKVVKLHRRQYGPLGLERLRPGQWRELTEKEIQKLM